jgi:hypothetical protein
MGSAILVLGLDTELLGFPSSGLIAWWEVLGEHEAVSTSSAPASTGVDRVAGCLLALTRSAPSAQ